MFRCFSSLLFSCLGKKKEYEIARLEQIEHIRRTEYCNFMDILQQMVNEGNHGNFLLLQKSINRLLLFAGPKLSLIINYISNQLYTFFFFTIKSPYLALIDTIIVLISSLFLYYESKELNKTSAKLLIPYMLFVTIITPRNSYNTNLYGNIVFFFNEIYYYSKK